MLVTNLLYLFKGKYYHLKTFELLFLALLAIGQWAYVMTWFPSCICLSICAVIFSSTGRRPASLCHGPLSAVCPSMHPLVRLSVRVLTFSLNIFSETTYRFFLKFHNFLPWSSSEFLERI